MSKSKKTKRKKSKSGQSKKKSKLSYVIALLIVFAIVVSIIVVSITSCAQQTFKSSLCDGVWAPISATDESGDEAELGEIYNTMYSSYKGSLSFETDGTFSLWMTPGDPDDGTHNGTYEVDENVIHASFEDGAETDFKIVKEGNTAKAVIVNYNNYIVSFEKQP